MNYHAAAPAVASGLFEEKQLDRFKQETPIRAFTSWDPGMYYAVGKGFRPSMAHLVSYLDAMREKEGWAIHQVLLSPTGGEPTILFTRIGPASGEYRFKPEAPIKAFTEWEPGEHCAVGDGFRPSMAHLVGYLDAMRAKEGWAISQILLWPTGKEPSMLFTKVGPGASD